MSKIVNEEGYIIDSKTAPVDYKSTAERLALEPIKLMTDNELLSIPTGSVSIFDVESYPNFFYISFKFPYNNKFVDFEISPDFNLNASKLSWLLWRFCLVGFNSRVYDIPMISYSMTGVNAKQLNEASSLIIENNLTQWDFQKYFKVQIQPYNHIDLIEVAPLQGSLKLYAGRLHCKTMQDLPFPPHHHLTKHEAAIVRPYCCNDLNNTELLFNELAPELKLRNEMSRDYGVDLRSKSDAQVAETVIGSELKKVLGYYPKKPNTKDIEYVQYNIPDFIEFQTPVLNNVLETIKNLKFYLDAMGSPTWPDIGEREKTKTGYKKIFKVKIGNMFYKLGMGGLHSTETSICYEADENTIIADNDVTSFYPRIILNQGLFPPHLGEAFLTVYEAIVNKRLDAKEKAKALKTCDRIAAAGFKTIADSLKIVINGSFGKLGNKYSILYSPQLLIQVTLTGQLVLLMLIEMLELAGIEVISGNTDGIISIYNKSRHEEVRNIISLWEDKTSFKTEETKYKAVYSRDVNNYIAIKETGDAEARFLDEKLGCKTKGTFCERGSALNSILSKNPETLICSDAVLQFLKNGIPLEQTIKSCTDLKRFVSVRNVKGGGKKDNIYLGKVVRWYYAKNEKGFISYTKSGNKVSKTDGAKPLMDLPEKIPADINFNWYLQTAIDMLFDIGKFKPLETESLF